MRKINIACLCSLLTLPTTSTFVVSCGQKPANPIEMVDVLNYESKVDPLAYDGNWWGIKEATNNYIGFVKNNPSIFIDDMLCSVRSLIEHRGEEAFYSEGLLLTSASCGISEPTFGTTRSWVRGREDIESPTVSFKQKIHLEYNTPSESVIVSKHVDVDMEYEYHDMIFTLCEDILNDGGGWSLGFFDWNVDDECMWPIIRNVNSWSINFNTTISKTTTYHSGERRPDVNIHNDSYYSGVVDDAVSLDNMLKGTLGASPIEALGVNFVLLGEADKYRQEDYSRFFKSHYLSNIVFKPDVRCWSPLIGKNKIGSLKIDYVYGLQLIFPSKMTLDYTFSNVYGVTLDSDLPWVLSEIDGCDRNITIDKEDRFITQIRPGGRKDELICSNTITLNTTFVGEHEAGETVPFIIPDSVMPLLLHYTNKSTGKIEVVQIKCPMLYDNLALKLSN